MNTLTDNPALTNPALTPEVLERLIAGEQLVEPLIAAALAEAEVTGRFECPYCHGLNDGILRIKNDGMGVESVAITLEMLTNPARRDFCLCQLIIITMQTGDEHWDTIHNTEWFVLPIYRYFRLRFVELARGGEYEEDGIVILQDTCLPQRLYREGYYKLSEHLLLNGTVPQAGSEHLCSLKWKVFCGEYWMEHCLQMHGFQHIFGYSADEPQRVAKSDGGIAKRNTKVIEKLRAQGATQPDARKGRFKEPRVRVRLDGDCRDNYELAEIVFDSCESSAQADDAGARVLAVHMTFGYNRDEQSRMAKATANDAAERVSYRYALDAKGRVTSAQHPDAVNRVGVYPLDEWATSAHDLAVTFPYHWLAFVPALRRVGSRDWCLETIFEWFGIVWEKSACVGCPFDAEASKCTEKGIARKKKHPFEVAEALLFEYASLCLNERGAIYVKRTLQQVVFTTEQLEAMAYFEQMLSGMEFSLLEVKRIYTKKGKAGRSVIKLATGTRARMTALFDESCSRLHLNMKTVHGINYGVFAAPTFTEERIVPGKGKRTKRIKPEMIFPAVEGFLVVAPAQVGQKVRGKFEVFERRFGQVARLRRCHLPLTPGAELVAQRKHLEMARILPAKKRKQERGLFDLAA